MCSHPNTYQDFLLNLGQRRNEIKNKTEKKVEEETYSEQRARQNRQ